MSARDSSVTARQGPTGPHRRRPARHASLRSVVRTHWSCWCSTSLVRHRGRGRRAASAAVNERNRIASAIRRHAGGRDVHVVRDEHVRPTPGLDDRRAQTCASDARPSNRNTRVPDAALGLAANSQWYHQSRSSIRAGDPCPASRRVGAIRRPCREPRRAASPGRALRAPPGLPRHRNPCCTAPTHCAARRDDGHSPPAPAGVLEASSCERHQASDVSEQTDRSTETCLHPMR